MGLKEDMAAAINSAKAIAAAATAQGRDLDESETALVQKHLDTYEAKRELYLNAQKGQRIHEQLKSIGGGAPDDNELTPARKTAGGGRGHVWAAKAEATLRAHGLIRTASADGTKALLSGSVSVPNLLDAGDAVEITAPRRTLIDLIGRGDPTGDRLGNTFGYIRQTTRTNNAAAIADGKPKPTSIYTFGEVTDHYRTYVNKTEDLPYRYLADYQRLMDVVERQLAEDMMIAIEADVLSGAGPAGDEDAFIGILETAGIQAQAYTTSVLQTLSNAKYKFITQELPFNGWVLNASDLQTLELMREDGATGPFLFPSRQAIEDFLGAPVVTSAGMPAGSALVGDFQQAELIPLGDDELVVDTGKRTTNNTFLLMHEGRYGFRVKKPVAFCEVDLTA